MRYGFYKLCLATLYATGIHRLCAPTMRGLGTILMLHHVRPFEPRSFAPNRALEITPEFLDRALTLVKARGFEIIDLDEVPERLHDPDPSRPFCAITVDDGYRDVVEFALPIFKKHKAPFTVFVTTGFAQGLTPLWWVDLELAIEKLASVSISSPDFHFDAACATVEEKDQVFRRLYKQLRKGPEPLLRKVVAELAAHAHIDSYAVARRLCLNFEELDRLADEPLVSIGAHTLTHPILEKHDYSFARREIIKSRAIIEEKLNSAIRHFAYPFGDRSAATTRDFYLAASAGFETAVTGRPGMLFEQHAAYLYALPRLALNGHFQSEAYLDVLLSGLPFALYNRGQRLSVA